MAETNIEYGELPKKSAPTRKLKWTPVIQEVIDNAPTLDDGTRASAKVAVRDTSSAASGIAQTLRKTAKEESLDVNVATRPEDPENTDGAYGVWLTPGSAASSNGEAEAEEKPAKKSTKKASTSKAKTTSKAKSSSTKKSSGRRRRTTSKS